MVMTKCLSVVHDIPPSIQSVFILYFGRNWTIDPITPYHQDGHVETINISSPLPLGLDLQGLITNSGAK